MTLHQSPTENFIESLKKLETDIIGLAWKDAGFRRLLVSNPREALEERFNIQFPAGFNLNVVEETASSLHFVLPYNASDKNELSDDDLDNVAGGSGGQGQTYSGC